MIKLGDFMKVTILGTGAYGLALSLMFNKNVNDIVLWTKFENEKDELEKQRGNSKVLPNIRIPDNIKITTDFDLAITDANLIVIAVPAAFVDDIGQLLKDKLKEAQHICIASKGIERDTCSFVHDILLRNVNTNNLAVISGPSFAIDIANMNPIGLTVATTNSKTENLLKETLQNDTLKLRTTDDIVGVEICGSIKNVIAIASGMLSGMNYSESTQAMFVTESLHDIKSLIDALGGNKKTILSFAGVGDLLLTATSTKSRNFKLGYLIGSNTSKEEVTEYMNNTTIEGLYTLKSIYKLIGDKQVDMPIIDLIYDIIYNNVDPKRLITFLIEKK